MPPPWSPSGQQYDIDADGHRATVVEVGGGVRVYEVGGRPVLDGYGAEDLASAGAGQILAPWPNRIRDGRYRFGGRDLQLPLTEAAAGNAIHGLTRWTTWGAVESGPAQVVLEHRLHPQPGYPFDLDLRVTWSVGADGLRADHEARNVGAETCPFGLGIHPYVRLPDRSVDGLVLTLPAARRLITDDRGLPVGEEPVEGSAFDFRSGRAIGATALDTPFGGLARGDDGLVRVTLSAPGGPGLEVWMDAAFGWVQLFTGDTLASPRRRRAVAVEPMTCPPDAFNSGVDLVTLAPGARWQGSWGIRPQ